MSESAFIACMLIVYSIMHAVASSINVYIPLVVSFAIYCVVVLEPLLTCATPELKSRLVLLSQ